MGFTDTTSKWANKLMELSVRNDFSDSEMNHGIVATSDGGTSIRYQTISSFISSHTWTTAFVHHWNRPEYINALEAHTAVLAIEWAASFYIQGCRVFLLSDSSVTIGVFRKAVLPPMVYVFCAGVMQHWHWHMIWASSCFT